MNIRLTVLTAVWLLLLSTVAVLAQAVDTSTAIYSANLRISNTAGAAQSDLQVPFAFSGQSLVELDFIDASGLNSVIIGPDGTRIPSMPASLQIAMESCKQDDGSVFTDFTTECNDSAVGDIDFLPATPVAGDAWYFGLHSSGRIVTASISQAAVNDAVIVWEYWNGAAWASTSNIDDTSAGFTVAGIHAVSFDLPADWADTVVDGVTSRWIRARVDSITTQTQTPLGTQAWWQSGNWWSLVDSIASNEQINYGLYLGGLADFTANHQVFVGSAGLTTADNALIEPGSGFSITIEAYINTAAGGSKDIILKTSAIRLYVNGASTLTAELNGGTATATVAGVSTGFHTITVSSDGTTFALDVEGVGGATDSAVAVTDNANVWNWGTNGSVVYFDSITIADPEVDSNTSVANFDAGTLVNTESVSGAPPGDPNHTRITGQDQAGTDDGEVVGSTYLATGSIIRFGFFAGTTFGHIWLRFSDVQIAQGELISTATIALKCNGSTTNSPVDVKIRAFDQDDATAPTSKVDFDGRARTTAQVDWNSVPNCTSSATTLTTPSIVSVIQEVVDRPGWTKGNSIVLVIEDNGTTCSQCNRSIRSIETIAADVPPIPGKLTFTLANQPTIPNDFVRITRQISTSIDWMSSNCTTVSFSPSIVKKGIQSADLSRTATNQDCDLFQDIPALPGEIWSIGAWSMMSASGTTNGGSVRLQWRNSGGGLLSEQSVSFANNTTYTWRTINNQTAPANTATLRVVLRIRSGTSTARGNYDGVMACICASVPNFPNVLNQVTNPSFEEVYTTSGTRTWVSAAFTPTITNLLSSSVTWAQTSPENAAITIETSIDNQATWQPVTANGQALPGVTIGQDLSSTNINVRVSFTSTDGVHTVEVGRTAVTLLSLDLVALQYQLVVVPGLTLSNTGSAACCSGTINYPLDTNTSLTVSQDPLKSLQVIENKQAQALSPDVVDIVDPGSWIGGTFDASSLPFNSLWIALSDLTGGDIPPIMYWIIFAAWVVIGAGLITFTFTQSVPWTAAVMGMFMMGFVSFGNGLFPMWVFFFFAVMAMAASIYYKVRAL